MTVRQGTQGPATTVRATVVAGLRTAAARVHDGAARVRWYVRQVMGDDAYATYAAHQRAVHPGGVVMTEREFWRMRHAEQDANPGSRCC
ncbi:MULTISPECIES: YbdD/YjiX family protein [Cellulosimicrobium]|uniref:YbdD/YjiX family protein n=1 Tax=Cellulosimicrobium TaxID=157920 RepID=UPI0029E7F957|nr:YbdD/YjiX family protein [Cellulosimicrobium cellulans]